MSTYLHFCNWKINNPEKLQANRIVFIEKRAGRIKSQPCEICGNEKSQAHHEDYSEPLEIVWLCKQCHTKLHIENGSFQNCGRRELL